jgi:hypothetical protein
MREASERYIEEQHEIGPHTGMLVRHIVANSYEGIRD